MVSFSETLASELRKELQWPQTAQLAGVASAYVLSFLGSSGVSRNVCKWFERTIILASGSQSEWQAGLDQGPVLLGSRPFLSDVHGGQIKQLSNSLRGGK